MEQYELFDRYKKDAWLELSEKVQGYYEEKKFTAYGRITTKVGPWDVVLDTYFKSARGGRSSAGWYTRLRAPFVNLDGFICEIYNTSFLSEMGKKLGMQDIVIDHELFDDKFIIKSNHEGKTKSLFDIERIRQLIHIFPEVYLQVRTDKQFLGSFHPAGLNEVYFETMETVSDMPKLESLFELYSLILNKLCNMDSGHR